jgi:hypothetical protein
MLTPRLACIVAAICLIGCGSRRVPIREVSIEDAQRMLVSDASEKLRNEFNQRSGGPCEAIEATAAFREDPVPDEWLRQCVDIRANLGAWHVFNIQSTQLVQRANYIVAAEGRAVFAKGSREIDLLWDVRKGRAELIQFGIKQADQHWLSAPSFPRSVRRLLQDPPMKPSTGDEGIG